MNGKAASSSDSEDEAPAKKTPVKPAVPPKATPAAKKAASSSDDSSEDEAPAKKTPAATPAVSFYRDFLVRVC